MGYVIIFVMSGEREISYTPAALKALTKMGSVEAKRIVAKVKQYAADPESLANMVKPLKGMDDMKRLRVGDYRVIFNETMEVVAVIRIGHRREIYD